MAAVSSVSSSSRRSSSFDLYQVVTDQVVAMLESGVAPWRSPILGRQSAGYPRNLASGKKYRGVNVFLLAFTAYAKGYESAHWLTMKQANGRGGNIRKGEKSSLVVFWKPLESVDAKTGEKKESFVLRYYNVFNADQCDGIAAPDAGTFTPIDFNPIEAAEKIANGYANGPTVNHGGSQAYYRPSTDAVQLPEPTRFASPEEYYGTRFHELAHSTGHSSRLGRGLDTDPKPFGSPDYGKEELIAELCAAFLCGHASITPATLANSAAYLDGWIHTLKQDKKLIVSSAGAAQRAADWILGERYEQDGDDTTTTATEPTSTTPATLSSGALIEPTPGRVSFMSELVRLPGAGDAVIAA
jgi:antirestriction protein ArdC